MNVLKPGQHGSTFGGNPVAARVAMTALEVVRDEKLAQNARVLGDLFRSRLQVLVDKYKVLTLPSAFVCNSTNFFGNSNLGTTLGFL